MHLSSLPIVDELRRTAGTRVIRTEGNNLDIIVPDDAPPGAFDAALCHLAVWLPFTQGNGKPVQLVYGEAAAIALAAQHLNAGDGSLVAAVKDLPARCPVRFTVELGDTQYDAGATLAGIVEQTGRPRGDAVQRLPCAFVGVYRSAISMPTSLFTGLAGYAQISGGSTSVQLDDVTQYPSWARTIPSDQGNAEPYVQFLHDVLRIRHLAVVNVNDAYGNSFVEGLRLARDKHAPGLLIHQIPLGERQQDIVDVVQGIKQARYRFIYCAIFTAERHDALLTEAYRAGVAGDGAHNWLFADTFGGVLDGREFAKGSILHQAYQGTAMIEASGGYRGIPRYELLRDQLRELRDDPDDLGYLGGIFPQPGGGAPPFVNDPNFLDSISSFTSFLYDATVAMGLAACSAASASLRDGEGRRPSFDGATQFEHLKNTTFEGASGAIVFDPVTGTRDPRTALYTVTNFVAEGGTASSDRVRFKKVLAAGFERGEWKEKQPYTFNDGTSELPADIPPPLLDDHHLHTAARAVAFAMSAIVVMLALGLMVWTRVHAKSRVVSASQPFFLYLICCGVMIVACATVPSAIDESIASTFACSIACNTIPWLRAFGIAVVLSSFVTKTHRILTILNNAQHFTRVKVEVKDVIKPMVCLLTANLLILSIMTGLSPSYWEKVIISYDDFERPSETEGSCIYQDQTWYLVLLGLLNLCVLFLAISEAFKARHLSLEFAESRYILYSMVFVVLVAFVGVPVYFMARGNQNTRLFVSSAITFIGCSSILLLMFVPKMQQLSYAAPKRSSSVNLSYSSAESHRSSWPASDTEEVGTRIITDKTAVQLSKENDRQAKKIAALHKLLQQKEQEIVELRAVASAGDDVRGGKKEDEGPVESMPVPSEENNSDPETGEDH